jgi:hypothetical protein
VFHVELRQFPHAVRKFNLGRAELEQRIVGPWTRGQAIGLDDHRFAPDRAKLAIYEGRGLEPDEIGMGRGWANVTRTGEDVTGRLLEESRHAVQSPPRLDAVKQALLAQSGQAPFTLAQTLTLIGELQGAPAEGERLELAARAVWELLAEGRLALSRPE